MTVIYLRGFCGDSSSSLGAEKFRTAIRKICGGIGHKNGPSISYRMFAYYLVPQIENLRDQIAKHLEDKRAIPYSILFPIISVDANARCNL